MIQIKNKMKYHVLEPEVIVGIGANTTGGNINSQDGITHLHIQMEDWLGDDLVEVFPCFLISQDFKEKIIEEKFSGYQIIKIEITKDEYFDNNYQLKKKLPDFYWLKINGKEGVDDLFIDENLKLNCTKEFLNYLKLTSNVKFLEVDPVRTERDDFLDELFK